MVEVGGAKAVVLVVDVDVSLAKENKQCDTDLQYKNAVRCRGTSVDDASMLLVQDENEVACRGVR